MCIRDRYAAYDEIRSVGNVVWNETLKGWVVVGYDEAVGVLTDPDRFHICLLYTSNVRPLRTLRLAW